ncbi:MAG: transcription termination factor NusA [Verrucomicrobiota bacterium]|nr:transcription termination factor NusA [Verrucomicrobiota bacterium]
MNAELIAGLDYLERERGINREVLIEAIQNALLSASKKSVGPARNLRIDIDRKTGAIRAIAQLVVVEKVTNQNGEVSLTEALKTNPEVKLGDEIDLEVTPAGFGRIASQTAKQAMMARLRGIEREKIFEEFKDREGDLITGTVRRFERMDVILDLGKFEAIMPSNERVPTEDYSVGDRIRGLVLRVDQQAHRDTQIILSRSHPEFVRRLFELEVSEINDGTIQIKSIVREAGFRTKVAVHSSDDKIDPVGACIGVRGARVKNICRELNNEKVDIIRWYPNIREFIPEALKPAKLKTIEIDEKNKRVLVKVDEDQLSVAIGKRGVNARLTSKITGWQVDIEKDTSTTDEFGKRVAQATAEIAQALSIDAESAGRLIKAGFHGIDMIADTEENDLMEAADLTAEKAKQIREKAIEISKK